MAKLFTKIRERDFDDFDERRRKQAGKGKTMKILNTHQLIEDEDDFDDFDDEEEVEDSVSLDYTEGAFDFIEEDDRHLLDVDEADSEDYEVDYHNYDRWDDLYSW